MRRLKRGMSAARDAGGGSIKRLPAASRDMDGHWRGFPGPAWPPANGEPIRVLCHAFACWGEGQEAYWVELARAMPRDEVRWYFLVDPPVGRVSVSGAEVGKALREFGEVTVLPAMKHLRQAAVRQSVLDWRPHLGHATNTAGAQYLVECGLPVVLARDGVEGLSACDWVRGVRARVAQSSAAAGANPVGVEVIPNGIGYVEWPAVRRDGVVALVGRLDADRNPELVLEAIALVPEARLEVVGLGRWREFDPVAVAGGLGCADRVTWHGQVSREEAQAIAGGADVVVCATQEGFGYGLLEGILGGAVPVVVSGAGYQTVLAQEAGGIVTGCDPAELAVGIRKALALRRSEAERRAVAEAVARKHAAEVMAARYLEVYRRLVPPVVDIVVVAHGEKGVSRQCLLHLLANTWWPHRLIMVDNGSPGDDITWLMREVALLSGTRCVLLRTDENRGCAGGRRLGLEHSEAEFVVTLDNDMLVPAGWLGPLVEAILEHDDAGAVGAWWNAYGPPVSAEPIKKRFGCSAALLRRVAIPADAYATDLAGGQVGNDTDVLWSMLEAGWNLYLDPRSYWLHLGGPPGLVGMTRRKVLGPGDERAARLAFEAKWAAPGVRRRDQ